MSNKAKVSKEERLYDVFLSHNGSDKDDVEVIAKRLEDEANLRPFLDKWHLVPGDQWQEDLEEALEACSTCAVFVGADGLSPWENEEMRAALNERVVNKSLRIIPVLLPGATPAKTASLPRFLRRFTWVDFRDGVDSSTAFQRLVAGIAGKPPGRDDSNQSAAQTNDQESIQWVIVLKGTVSEVDKTLIENITNQLREISGDASLTIRKVKRGSVILFVESSEDAFERINSEFHTGELERVEGMRIDRVSAYKSRNNNENQVFWYPILSEIAKFGNLAPEDLSTIDSRDLAIVLQESQHRDDEDLLLTPRIFAEWSTEILTQLVKWAHRHKSVRSGGIAVSYLAEHVLRSYEISRKLPTMKEGSGKSG